MTRALFTRTGDGAPDLVSNTGSFAHQTRNGDNGILRRVSLLFV